MKKIEFKPLTADQVEVRPTDTKNKGRATLLLYQTARCPMEILDETFPGAWATDYKEVAGNVYCGIGIKVEDEWIWRWNAGTEGNIGEGKSTASDAFKRAATMWGIGRELYNTPKVKIDCPDNYYWNDKMTMTFSVKEVEFDERKNCTKLIIVDRFGKEVYNYKDQVPNESRLQMTAHKTNAEVLKGSNKDNLEVLRCFCRAKIEEEPEWKDDIIRFGKFYSSKVMDWDGEFMVDKLYSSWASKRRVA